MKKVIFIGNRFNTLSVLLERPEKYNLINIFIIEGSFLHKEANRLQIPYQLLAVNPESKFNLLLYLKTTTYDFLISNGCPFILPISDLRKTNKQALFINTHPTYLPYLKGKTPLNGVLFNEHNFIGATTHYMDDGIDSGNIIFQQKKPVTPDIDLGLVYFLSFTLEGEVFRQAVDILERNEYVFWGEEQSGEGSYFNRDKEIESINFDMDSDEIIVKKVRSVGIPSQGILITSETASYKVFEADKIINIYLLNIFAGVKAGEILLTYSNKILVKTKDGIVKFSHV